MVWFLGGGFGHRTGLCRRLGDGHGAISQANPITAKHHAHSVQLIGWCDPIQTQVSPTNKSANHVRTRAR